VFFSLFFVADGALVEAEVVIAVASGRFLQHSTGTSGALNLIAECHFNGMRLLGVKAVIFLILASFVLVKLIVQIQVAHVVAVFIGEITMLAHKECAFLVEFG